MADQSARYLTTADIAGGMGVSRGTLLGYLRRTRARIAAGEPVRPYDFPLPDARLGSTQGWRPETVEAWLAARPKRGGGTDPAAAPAGAAAASPLAAGSEPADDAAGFLAPADIAERIGVSIRSVLVYLQRSRARLKSGEQLRPQDLPLPDRTLGKTPVWHPGSVSSWIAARPGRGR